jgi:uncharacterized protein (DUF1330 family)
MHYLDNQAQCIKKKKSTPENTLDMKAYLIVDVTITDPVLYEEYKKLTPASIAAYDGRFVVRGGQTETLEGDWRPGRMVVLEFPSAERAKEWWHSALYSKAKEIRQRGAITKMIVVEGV